MAKELAEAVEKAATILGVKVVVAIRDEGANLVLLHAMDDSYIASVQASQDKAYTAVALKMPTHIALDESRQFDPHALPEFLHRQELHQSHLPAPHCPISFSRAPPRIGI